MNTDYMTLSNAIAFMEKKISDPSIGLPDDIFLFISRNTPMVNVDLLVKDERKRVLLAWRDDPYSGTGWHIPGGIIRYKEKFETRIHKVANLELHAEVDIDPLPLAINEVFCEQKNRGHFISLLFRVYLDESFELKNIGKNQNEAGFLKWHSKCPDNLIEVQNMYRSFIG